MIPPCCIEEDEDNTWRAIVNHIPLHLDDFRR